MVLKIQIIHTYIVEPNIVEEKFSLLDDDKSAVIELLTEVLKHMAIKC